MCYFLDFIKKLFGFSLGPFIGAVISFITIPITTYFINPIEYGKSSMFLTLQILLVSLVYLGFDQAFSREYHLYDNKKKLFQNSIFFPLCFSLALTILFIIFRKEISFYLFQNTSYSMISISLGILLFFTVIERFILMDLRMQEKAVVYSLYSILLKLSILIITIIYILLGYRNFLVVVNSTIFGQILFDIFLLYKYRDLFDFRDFRLDKNLWKTMLIFGLPLMIATFLTSFLNSSGRFFLGNFGTYYDLGIFTATVKVAGLLTIIQSSFTSFWLPTAYRWNEEKKDLYYFKLVSDSLCLILSLVIMIIIFFKKFVVLIISPDYIEAQFILPLMCLSPLLFTLSETVTLGIAFSRKSYLNIYIGIFSIIPSIVLNVILIPNLGTKGAAISQAFGFLLFYFLRSYYSEKQGFKFNIFRQKVIVILLFLISIVNLFDSNLIILLNFMIFFIIILIQKPVLIELRRYLSEKS